MKLFNLFEEQTAERKETRKFAFILQYSYQIQILF